MFLYRQNGSGMMCCFAEIDLGTMSRWQLEAKFRRYDVWRESKQGTQYLKSIYSHFGAMNPRNAFRILFVDASGNGSEYQVTESNRLEFISQLPGSLRRQILFSRASNAQASTKSDSARWNWTNSTGAEVSFLPVDL